MASQAQFTAEVPAKGTIYHTQIQPSKHDIVALSQDIKTVDTASDWVIANRDTILRETTHNNLTFMHCYLMHTYTCLQHLGFDFNSYRLCFVTAIRSTTDLRQCVFLAFLY